MKDSLELLQKWREATTMWNVTVKRGFLGCFAPR